MTWRRESTEPIAKPSSVERHRKRKEDRLALEKNERDEKSKVRRRDKRCRFPLCDCASLNMRLEVSHEIHKGQGGDKTGERSKAAIMFLLCIWRHQQGRVARGKGTLKPRYLTDKQANGPVAWEVDLQAIGIVEGLPSRMEWFEVAREKSIGVWEPFTVAQLKVLTLLAEMRI